jgi:hypothetical protein
LGKVPLRRGHLSGDMIDFDRRIFQVKGREQESPNIGMKWTGVFKEEIKGRYDWSIGLI